MNLPNANAQVCLYLKQAVKDVFFSAAIVGSITWLCVTISCWIYSNSRLFTLRCTSGLLYIKDQKNIQRKPNAPITIKAISQPQAFAMKGIVIGAANAPTVAPALKMLVANALSFLGKYSAVALIAAGKFPASPRARIKRAKMKRPTLVEMISAVSPTVPIRALAPSKPTNQSPVSIPEV